MNWLERARREIRESAGRSTANSAERTLTAVTAVLDPVPRGNLGISNGSNGSGAPMRVGEIASERDEFEERAAIMEFDGGMSRDAAERHAWALALKRRRLH
jgi:hypothetical protein